MSIVFNGSTQLAEVAAVPSVSSFVVAGWFRRTSDSGVEEVWVSSDDGSYFNQYRLRVNTSDELQGTQVFTQNAVNVSPVTNTWYYVTYRYSGGTMAVRHLADGDTAFQSDQSTGGLSDATPDTFTIGAQYGGGTPEAFAPMTCASLKVWSGGTLPTDGELLTERLNTDVTVTTGLWASYDFLTGALDTDRSGNSRTLTLTASPTYTADAPTDLAYGNGGIPPTKTLVSLAGKNPVQFGSGPNIIILS